MKLKDVLHYYLGCEYRCDYVEGGKINYICKDFYGEGKPAVRDNENSGWIAATLIKPILSKLEDMSEEDAIECAKLSEWEPHFTDVKVERTKYGDLLVKWQGNVEGGEQQNITGDMFYCAEQFHYLLSKGYDLFNLIETNQAIDRKNT